MSRAAVAFLVSSMLTGCVGEQIAGVGSEPNRRVAAALAHSGVPDSDWVTAALLRFSAQAHDGARSAEFEAALNRASDSAPSDRAVAIVLLRLCDSWAAYDVHSAAERVSRIDPGSGVGLLPVLHEAVESGEDARIDGVLARMSAAEHWNLYFNETVTRFAGALVAAAPHMSASDARSYADFETAYVTSVGWSAGFLLPPLAPVSRACRDPAPARRVACMAVAQSMHASDTLVMSGFGAAMALHLATPGSPEHDAAVEARRRHEWQLDALETIDPTTALRESSDLVGRFPREQDVVTALMQRHGIAMDPPAGWRPEIQRVEHVP